MVDTVVDIRPVCTECGNKHSGDECPKFNARLRMWSDEEEWIIATDLEDLAAVLKDMKSDADPENFYERRPESTFVYHHEDGRKETKMVAEWVAEHGRGWFACSDG